MYLNNVEQGNTVYASYIEANPCENCRNERYCIINLDGETCYNNQPAEVQGYIEDCINDGLEVELEFIDEMKEHIRRYELEYEMRSNLFEKLAMSLN